MLRSTRIVIYSLFLAFAIAIAIAQGAAAATITSPGAVQAGILHLSKVPNSSPSHSIPKVRGVIPLSTNRLLSRDCPRTLSTMDSAFVPCLYLVHFHLPSSCLRGIRSSLEAAGATISSRPV